MRKCHKRLCQLCHRTVTRIEIRTPHTSADLFESRLSVGQVDILTTCVCAASVSSSHTSSHIGTYINVAFMWRYHRENNVYFNSSIYLRGWRLVDSVSAIYQCLFVNRALAWISSICITLPKVSSKVRQIGIWKYEKTTIIACNDYNDFIYIFIYLFIYLFTYLFIGYAFKRRRCTSTYVLNQFWLRYHNQSTTSLCVCSKTHEGPNIGGLMAFTLHNIRRGVITNPKIFSDIRNHIRNVISETLTWEIRNIFRIANEV